jgi:histidinol phosphatase-like PHP family hydrolase
MIDFHTHSLLSDGELLPSELARRAEAKGYRAIGISDHVDCSNADFIIPRLLLAGREIQSVMAIEVFAGAEITHVPPGLIAAMVSRCRELGAEYLVVHGETIVEPVQPGTNDAALDANIDILSHPGLLTPEQARRAAARGIFLEISCRAGHCLTNGHVARTALAAGAKLLVGSDAHAPCDLVAAEEASRVARGAGLMEREVKAVWRNAELLLRKLKGGRRHGAKRQI